MRGETARYACPAGESPVPVSIGAPGSRPQVFGGDPFARAGRQKPMMRQEPYSGEQVHGPQHEVKPAASTDKQSGSRAAHVTVKAMHDTGRDPEPVACLGGVRGVARGQGQGWNTRDPSRRLSSQRARPYKPKAKSGRAERESEGIVVPLIAVTNNAAVGKDPWGGNVAVAGKHEGMAAKSGPNDPAGLVPSEEVRQLRERLWTVAKWPPSRKTSRTAVRPHRRDYLCKVRKRYDVEAT
jgi:hypothetical protein